MFIQLFYLIDRYYILAFEWFCANICLKQVTNVSLVYKDVMLIQGILFYNVGGGGPQN